jgi:ABC-type transporter lipoprotein component MlaA/predicted alpha/beta-fold hydrolase
VWLYWLLSLGLWQPLAHASAVSPAPARSDTNATFVLPQGTPDPIEPVNRAIWAVNKGLLTGIVKPTAKAYRFVVRKPVRIAISNFGRNITYPDRFINNLLEGKWLGAGHETERFLCNTTIGLAGCFDPATHWKIPKSDADFGLTFGQWGWKPHAFLMLPIYGPSNERDTVGLAGDTAVNPLTYLTPYNWVADDPLTYISPYAYANYAILYNNLTDTVDEYDRFTRTEMDAYSELEYAWGFIRENRIVDFQVKGEPDPATLETLETVFFTFKNPQFPERGETRTVWMPTSGNRLKFSYWLQPKKAPIVFIVPGLGSHRLAETALALAELIYGQGFSVVTVSNPFNYEFMEEASSTALPGYTLVDAQDLQTALSQIARHLDSAHPGRLGAKAVLGYSMGAFESLFLAGNNSSNDPSLVQFDRYVAINTPVRLLYGVSKLDAFYRAPLAWPAEERENAMENTFLKIAALTKNSLTPQASLPFSSIESEFIIGLVFRYILRDVIYDSQTRHNLGVLQHPIRKWRREPVYQEILQYSYSDYFAKFVVPYYLQRGIDLGAPGTLEQASDLRSFGHALHNNPNVRIFVNRDDFLLAPSDLDWLQATFPPDRLTIFEQGGHLGNLFNPAVQKAILAGLDSLK